eukprot:TRINITY_DN1925_c0_g1_i3.p1 TRINITY_DN1925_c0_g1~~TRINITY_DN1925_c0_g1_i3.p1  ORF type:complete len:615 (-),score=64.47 TRINITY_DN1925_c0_g1_i3:21-1865(-)
MDSSDRIFTSTCLITGSTEEQFQQSPSEKKAQKMSRCPHCHKMLKHLKQHMDEVHRNTALYCESCEKSFGSLRSLKRHRKLVHLGEVTCQEKIYETCVVCRASVEKKKLSHHIEIQHLLPLKFCVPCPLCPARVKFLPYHIRSLHSQVNIRRDLYACRKCGQYFVSAQHLDAHDREHETYPCSLCDKVFEKFIELGWHCLKHHNLVFNPGTSKQRIRRKVVEPSETDMNKLQLYSVQGLNSYVESGAIYKEIEVDVLDNDQVDKILVTICHHDYKDDDSSHKQESECVDDPSEDILSDNEINEEQQDLLSFSQDTQYGGGTSCHSAIDDYGSDSELELIEEENVYIVEDAVNGEDGTYFNAEEDGNEGNICLVYEGDAPAQIAQPQLGCQESDADVYIALDIAQEQFVEMEVLDTQVEEMRQVQDDRLEGLSKIFKSKAEVPRDTKGLTLSMADEHFLNSLTKRELLPEELNKLQVNETPQDKTVEVEKKKRARHRYLPSRQAHMCPYCRIILKTRYSLKSHIAVKHMNDKPFSCKDCGRRFHVKCDLVKHKKTVHSGQGLVTCDICDNSYSASYIKRHRGAAHGAKIITECDICHKVYKSRQIMLQHRRQFHK